MADHSPIPGAKIMLVGDTGSGKTHCVRTLLDVGITPFVLFTEPGMEILSDIPPAADGACRCHWHYIPPANPDWDVMVKNAETINKLSFESLSKLTGMQKDKYSQFIDLLKSLSNFTCDKCGKSFGPVDDWNTDRAIVLDSLSGINVMAMNLVVGSQPVKAQGDWQVAMDNEERLVQKLCTAVSCWMIMTAHPEREHDEVTGGLSIMAGTLGRKLAPKLPRFFSDVIYTYRVGTTFLWSTATVNVVTKPRNVPISDKLPPSFKPLVTSWINRGGKVCMTTDRTPTVPMPEKPF